MNVLSFRNKAKNSKTALYFGAPEAEAESLPTSRVALSDVYEDHHDLLMCAEKTGGFNLVN